MALGFAFLATAGAEPTAVERHGRLRVQGNQVLDEHGEPVTLRGMSMFWSQLKGQERFYNTNVIRWLRDDWHCNIVRAAMGIEMNGYLAHPEREKARIQTVVQAAIDLGIYVIIDWHDHNANQHTAEAEKFFGEMARQYASCPNVIYEIWNEPLNTHGWDRVIKPYAEAVIPAIRASAPDNLIVVGTPTWSQDVDVAAENPLAFTNVVYALHFYAATHHQELRDKAERALKSGAALMVTEWGTCEANGSGRIDMDDLARWQAFMEANHLSSCNWSVAALRETSAALVPGADSDGAWPTNEISRSGNIVRDWLRQLNPAP